MTERCTSAIFSYRAQLPSKHDDTATGRSAGHLATCMVSVTVRIDVVSVICPEMDTVVLGTLQVLHDTFVG